MRITCLYRASIVEYPTAIYCAEAIALNYMATNVSIFTLNRVSSDAACQQVTIAWESFP